MSDDLTPARLDEIEEVAWVATDGPWSVGRYDEIDSPEGPLLAVLSVGDCGVVRWTRDATHIATFDPPTALALVAEVRELRAKVERVRELHRENAYPDRPVSRCRDCDDVWPCETARALGEEA